MKGGNLENLQKTHEVKVQGPIAKLTHFSCWIQNSNLTMPFQFKNWLIRTFFQVADLTHFLRMSDSRLQFIWSSEISGYRHLYLATANSNHTLTRARAGSFIAECCIHYPLVTQRQLTDGDWEVDGKEVGTWKWYLFKRFIKLPRMWGCRVCSWIISLQHPVKVGTHKGTSPCN